VAGGTMAAVVDGLREPWLGPPAACLAQLAAWPGPPVGRRGPRCRRLGPRCRRLGPRCRRLGPRCRRLSPRCRRLDPRCPPGEVRGPASAARTALHFRMLAAQRGRLRPRGSALAVRLPGRASARCGPKRAAAPGLPPHPACRGPSCPTVRPRSPVRPGLAADSPGGLRHGLIPPRRAWPAGPVAVTAPAWEAIAPRRFPVILSTDQEASATDQEASATVLESVATAP